MKSALLIFLLIVVIDSLHAQPAVKGYKVFMPDTANAACIEEMKRAEKDFTSGTYSVHLPQIIPFSNTQQKLLKNNYGVTVYYDLIYIEYCYNYRLKSLLNGKFKENIIERTKALADSLDEAGLGNRQQRAIKSGPWLSAYIKEHLSDKSWEELKRKYGTARVRVGFGIDATGAGKVKGIDIDLRISHEPLIAKALKGAIFFYPRIANGRAVKSEMWIPVNFDL